MKRLWLLLTCALLALTAPAWAQDKKKEAAMKAAAEKRAAEEAVSSEMRSKIKSALGPATQGKYADAISKLEPLMELPKGGFLAAYNVGVLYEMQNKEAPALKAYLKALEQNASCSPALFNAAKLHMRAGRMGEATKLVNRYMNKRQYDVGHRVVELETLLEQGRYEDVTRKAKAALKMDERSVGAMVALADANYALKRYELARTVITRAQKLSPQRGDLYYRLGLISLQAKEKGVAITHFQKAVELRPRFPEAHNNLGLLYHEARDYQNALAEFKAAVRDAPAFKEAHLNMGNAYKGLKKFKEAEGAFKRAIELDKRYGSAHFNLAVLYMDTPVPGMELIPRLQKSIETFKTYKTVMGSSLSRKDKADTYVAAAKKMIKDEKDRQELMRQSQMNP